MAERLTKEYYYTWDENGTKKLSYIQKLQNKLGKLEDILEKYGIESVEELECLIEQTPKFIVKETSEKYGQEINGVFFSNEQMLILSQYNELQEPYKKRYEQVKIDRDTWKKACELAVRHTVGFAKANIPEQVDWRETRVGENIDYFYQQAKKEGNDE